MRGRKPLPTAVKEASGALQKDPQRRNKSEPKPMRGSPEVPESLLEDPVAIGCWNRTCKTLDGMGILTLAEESVLELYCRTYSQWRYLSAFVSGGNCTVITERGTATSPEANQVHKYSATLIKLMAELGLTPSSRSRIHAVPEEEDDPFAEFLKRRMSGDN